jgi:hypothetical protein
MHCWRTSTTKRRFILGTLVSIGNGRLKKADIVYFRYGHDGPTEGIDAEADEDGHQEDQCVQRSRW